MEVIYPRSRFRRCAISLSGWENGPVIAKAHAIVNECRQTVEITRRNSSAQEGVFPGGCEPHLFSGPNTFMDDLITLLGATNIAHNSRAVPLPGSS